MGLDVAIEVHLLKETMDLQFQNISYSVKSKGKGQKTILDNVSGKFTSGRLIAIMGPSGAGKTSLLNVLSGSRKSGVEGSILVNNAPRKLAAFRRKSSYIPQTFAMLPMIKVHEALHFAADLKLESTVSSIQKSKIVMDIINKLGLKDSTNTLIKHLSGGEKKRLSIGVELITNPQIMFFDEPTSGLDSMASMQVIDHLKNLAQHGNRIIVCVIHSPNSQILSLFDDMYIISKGKCFYSGPLDDMVQTFKNHGLECPNFYNRADYALEIASAVDKTEIDRLMESETKKYCQSSYPIIEHALNEESKLIPCSPIKDCISESTQQYPISQISQLMVLTRRTILCHIRDSQLFWFRFVSQILIGVLIGLVYYDIGNDASKITSNASCIFFFLMVVFFNNTFPVIMSFPVEANVFAREHSNNWYSVRTYLASKMLAEAPAVLLGPTFFLLIAYYMTGQPLEGHRFMRLLLLCLLFALFSHSYGLLAGTLFKVEVGAFIVPATCVPMLIFSGFFIRFKELSPFFQPLTYLSYFRYAFEGGIQVIYGYERTALECSEDFCYYKSAKKFLKFMHMEENKYSFDVMALIVFVVVTQTALYFALKFKSKRSKF